MSTPATILAIDPQAVSPVRKFLESPDRIVVLVSNVPMAVHAASTMMLAVVLADLSLPQHDLERICKIARTTSPQVRVLLACAHVQEPMARRLLEQLEMPGSIVYKPWNGISLRKTASVLVDAWRKATVNGGVGSFAAVGGVGEHAHGPDPNLYELREVLGSGGTGTVFLARDRFLDMDVAIKVINPKLVADEDTLRAFKNEARITMQLSHRFILRLYTFSAYNGCSYIVMENVRGRSLRDLVIEYGCFSPATVCRILMQLASAFEYAHSHNVIHQDIKPENIYVSEAGELKIIDWGSATLNSAATDAQGYIVGTPAYMSPEQLRGEVVGPATDQFALGILTYLLLTGYFPYPPDTTPEALLQGVAPTFEALPPELAAVLSRATAAEPSDRYPGVTAFMKDVLAVFGADWMLASLYNPIVLEKGQLAE